MQVVLGSYQTYQNGAASNILNLLMCETEGALYCTM
jgi:hypothetical protein